MWGVDTGRSVDQVVGGCETIAGGDFLHLVGHIGVPRKDRRFERRVLRVVQDLAFATSEFRRKDDN